MELRVVSWDGHDLDNSSYEAYFPAGSVMLQADGKPVIVERPHFAPYYVAKNRSSRILPIHIKLLGTIATQRDTIATWFNTFDDSGLKKLTVRDEANCNRYWYVMATPISQPALDGSEIVVNLLVPDAVWFSDDTTTDTWNVTGTGQTHDVGVTGNAAVDPVITISPQDEKSTGAAYRCFLLLYPKDGNTMRGEDASSIGPTPTDFGDASWDTATLVGAGKMQSDGSDIQVLIDGTQSNYWLDDMNTSNTKLWVNIPSSYTSRQTTLGTAIASSGAIDTISIQNTPSNITALENMPARGIVLIGSELFTYQGKSVTGLTLYDIQRARYETTAAAHSASDAVIWIKHEIWLYYGNHGLTAFTVDDDYKPMFRIDTSTNTSWDYDDFWETDSDGYLKPRGAHWAVGTIGQALSTSILGTTLYYESMTASAPDTQTSAVSTTASVLGLFTKAGNGTAATGILQTNTDTFTNITASGSKWYAVGADWFDDTWREYYTGGNADLFSEAAPALENNIEAWSNGPTALTNNNEWIYPFLYRASTTGEARFEASDVTLTLDSAEVQTHSIGTETECYHINATITNNTSGEYITVSYRLPLGEEIVIDTEDKSVIWTEENENARGALGFSTIRYDWLQFSAGGNELQYDETGAADVDITIQWQDRNS